MQSSTFSPRPELSKISHPVPALAEVAAADLGGDLAPWPVFVGLALNLSTRQRTPESPHVKQPCLTACITAAEGTSFCWKMWWSSSLLELPWKALQFLSAQLFGRENKLEIK